ncbi:MAG: FtsX-like permease family protein [Chromatiales bacterium]|nr:FtsX-like permease family protein [Chromatiales bacterium]
MMQLIIGGLRSLWRERTSAEIRLLAVALVIAVASVTAVAFLTDRINGTLSRQAAELLAADLVVSGPYPIKEEWRQQAAMAGLQTADSIAFGSVVLTEEETLLTAVKAVSDSYPLRGRLRTAGALFEGEQAIDAIPQLGEVWVEPRLLRELALNVGDELELGASRFRIARVLTYEPDRGGNLIRIAPRVLMNKIDLPATRLVTPASRVRYSLLLAGPADTVSDYARWLSPRLSKGFKVQDVTDARPELATALKRAQSYFGLVSLMAALLAGITIAMATRRFVDRRLDGVALLRCLGVSRRRALTLHLSEILWLALPAALLGSVFGWLTQLVLIKLLVGQLPADLPTPSVLPVVQGLLLAMFLLLGFALPPLLRLGKVSPLKVLRRELAPPALSNLLLYVAALLGSVALLAWQARDAKLTAYVAVGSIAAVVVTALSAWLLVWLLGRLRQRVGTRWRFGFANLARRPATTIAQTSALGLGIMAILLLAFVRSDLMDGWIRALPEDAPNHFLINIQPADVGALRERLGQLGIESAGLYPMVRGRLTAINGQPVDTESYENERARRLLSREFNLSHTLDLPQDNRILAGQWLLADPLRADQISVEAGLAQTLGLKLGDRLEFTVAGQATQAQISSLRSVQWDSFRPNFFVIGPPAWLDSMPATYITSFHLPPEQRGRLTGLVRSFPSVTILDVVALMRQVRDLLNQVSRAIEFLFLFSLISAATVLWAAIQQSAEQRRQESALLRTLGASSATLWQGLAAEFLALGAIAGIIGTAGAAAVAWSVSTQLLELDYQGNPWMWITGMGLGLGVVTLAGLASLGRSVHTPPAQALR